MFNTTTQPPVLLQTRPFNFGNGPVLSTTQGTATAGSSTVMLYGSIYLPGTVAVSGIKVLLGTGGNGNIVAGIWDISGQTQYGTVASVATGTTATTQSLALVNGAQVIDGPRHILVGFILSSASDSLRTIPAVFDAGSNPIAGSVTVTANTIPSTFTPSATTFTADKSPWMSVY